MFFNGHSKMNKQFSTFSEPSAQSVRACVPESPKCMCSSHTCVWPSRTCPAPVHAHSLHMCACPRTCSVFTNARMGPTCAPHPMHACKTPSCCMQDPPSCCMSPRMHGRDPTTSWPAEGTCPCPVEVNYGDDSHAYREGAVCHKWHTCHWFAITGLVQ